MKCKNCGKELDPNKDFCFFCGASYKNKELDNKIKKDLNKENVEEKQVDNVITIIFGIVLFLSVSALISFYIFFEVLNVFTIGGTGGFFANIKLVLPIVIVLLIFIVISIYGLVTTTINNTKKEKEKK